MESLEPEPEGMEPEMEPEPEPDPEPGGAADAEVRWLYGPPALRETYCDDLLGAAGAAARGLLGDEGLSGLSSYSFSNEPPDAQGRGRRRGRRARVSGESSFTMSRCEFFRLRALSLCMYVCVRVCLSETLPCPSRKTLASLCEPEREPAAYVQTLRFYQGRHRRALNDRGAALRRHLRGGAAGADALPADRAGAAGGGGR